MKRTVQPPLPNGIDVTELKKRDTASVREYLRKLSNFSRQSGVHDAFIEALKEESFFVDLIRPTSQTPRPKSKKHRGPSQGLVVTGYEEVFQPNFEVVDLSKKNPQLIKETLNAWLYYLAFFNHPEYLDSLFKKAAKPFVPPQKKLSRIMLFARLLRQSFSIQDITLSPGSSKSPRGSRTKVLTQNLHVSYWRKHHTLFGTKDVGRKQARHLLVVGENPDVTGSALMIATLAATHHIVGVPKDGFFKDVDRQVALVEKAIKLLGKFVQLVGRSDKERKLLLDWYMHNIAGVLEADPQAAAVRAKALYAKGVRVFRMYSPEPNQTLLETTIALRKLEKEQKWEPIEIFAGQVVSLSQAQALERAGADAIYLGIGGGGRCITGVVANLAIDWAQLLWKLRGEVSIPIIVQGGANDNPLTTLALGASGIGVVGKLACVLEGPGGALYFRDKKTKELFRFYGGEASNRMRAMAGRKDYLQRTINTEGETTRKRMCSYPEQGIYATALQRLAVLMEQISTGFVFQNSNTLEDIQELAPSRLRRESPWMHSVRQTH